MNPTDIACLGPTGSFSHMLAGMRFPAAQLHPLGSIADVFDLLAASPGMLGIVPIENSSGGFIIDTVDRLVDERCDLWILEELTLDVKLALLGREGAPVEVIYSHPMPFFHADEWLRRHHPAARRVTRPSTAAAAEEAAREAGAAAIGPRQNAARHGLDLLHFPIAGEVPNITQFFLLGHQRPEAAPDHNRTAMVVDLADKPGSLCLFLTPLSKAGINLKRLESRPLRGQPNRYRFFIEVEASASDPRLENALARAETDGARIRHRGSYTSGLIYET